MAELSPRMQRLVQPRFRSIEPYDPNFTPTRINLSANENTHPLPADARKAVDEALAAIPLNRYPDPMSDALRSEIAARHGITRAQVCVGNGGDEILYNFLLAFGGRGRTVLICPPCFSEYAFFAQLTETHVRNVGREARTFALDEEALLASARSCDLVIITSPNNPTGDLADPGLIQRTCHACHGLVMVDEAYIEFAGEEASSLHLLESLDNLVILRTLSKAYGAAGTRCGYALAAPDVIAALSAVRQIYSVNVLTQAAALALIRHTASFEPLVDAIVDERERMRCALMRLPGVTVWPSRANFLLVRLPNATTIRNRLRDDHSILVRDFSATPGLDDCLRFTVGTAEENDALITALSELLSEED